MFTERWQAGTYFLITDRQTDRPTDKHWRQLVKGRPLRAARPMRRSNVILFHLSERSLELQVANVERVACSTRGCCGKACRCAIVSSRSGLLLMLLLLLLQLRCAYSRRNSQLLLSQHLLDFIVCRCSWYTVVSKFLMCG